MTILLVVISRYPAVQDDWGEDDWGAAADRHELVNDWNDKLMSMRVLHASMCMCELACYCVQ